MSNEKNGIDISVEDIISQCFRRWGLVVDRIINKEHKDRNKFISIDRVPEAAVSFIDGSYDIPSTEEIYTRLEDEEKRLLGAILSPMCHTHQDIADKLCLSRCWTTAKINKLKKKLREILQN